MNFNNREIDIEIWSGENLGPLVCIDTETTIAPFTSTPDLVTIQVYAGGNKAFYVELKDLKSFLLKHYDSALIGHNMPFDCDVIHKYLDSNILYDWYDRDLIYDTGVMYRLLHLAQIGFVPFKWSLAFLTKKFLNIELEKENSPRCEFGSYLNTPLGSLPNDLLEYGAKDVICTWDLFHVLKSRITPYDKEGTLLSQHIQVKGDLALSHIYKNGIGFDEAGATEWMSELNSKMEPVKDRLASWGWVRGNKGINDRFESIISMYGLDDKLPRTESGAISSKSEDLEPYRHIPFIDDYLLFSELEKASTFVRNLSGDRQHPKYNLLVNTGRTSCASPNFQQLPRIGGVRELFQASEGHTLIITDYSAIELSTLSQVTLKQYGESVMGDKINEGVDLHRYYASVMHSCRTEDVTKDQRQEAKAANFGYPGGLGIDTFIQFSKGYGLDINTSQAQTMKDTWFEAFPEMRSYMREEEENVYTLTGRRRANCSYCAGKNTPFQGLAADGAKLALYALDRVGFKIVGFVHDEIICEVREEDVETSLPLMEKIMVDSMATVVPDIKVSVESQISKKYCK